MIIYLELYIYQTLSVTKLFLLLKVNNKNIKIKILV